MQNVSTPPIFDFWRSNQTTCRSFWQPRFFFNFWKCPKMAKKGQILVRPDWSTGTKLCAHYKVHHKTGEWPFICFHLLCTRPDCHISRTDYKQSATNWAQVKSPGGWYVICQKCLLSEISFVRNFWQMTIFRIFWQMTFPNPNLGALPPPRPPGDRRSGALLTLTLVFYQYNTLFGRNTTFYIT